MSEHASREMGLIYAFGHLVSGYAYPDDAHSADSLDLAREVLESIDCPGAGDIETLAEYVAGNHTYTGEALETQRKIEAGEL